MNHLLQKPVFRYLAPFVVFMLLTELQRFADARSIFFLYALKTFLTAALLFWGFRGRPEEIPGSWDFRAAALGILVLILWLIPALFWAPAETPSFNPEVFATPAAKAAAILIRIAGAVLVVPLMEELVWRSFLMRYLIQNDFLKIPLGTFKPFAFWMTVGAFTLVHRSWEWPAAVLTGVLYGGYLVKTRNLKGCVLAHAVTNLGLGLYTVVTRQWFFW